LGSAHEAVREPETGAGIYERRLVEMGQETQNCTIETACWPLSGHYLKIELKIIRFDVRSPLVIALR
jgi:hypothetical protein